MARIRTIKPEFFEDEALARLPPHARLLYIGTWGLADKNGVLEDRPRWIQAKVFPYENGETADVSRLLPGLVSGGYLGRYEVDGRAYLAVRNFAKHQRITGKEALSEGRHPLPPNDLWKEKHTGNTGEASGKHPGAQEQGTGNREQGGGKGNAEYESAAAPRPTPTTALQAIKLTDIKAEAQANRMALVAKCLRQLGLRATKDREDNPGTITEWGDLMTGPRGRCHTTAEVLAGIPWIIAQAKRRGMVVEYAKHAAGLADEWGTKVKRARAEAEQAQSGGASSSEASRKGQDTKGPP